MYTYLRVVTGVRFVKVNKIIHLQLQEGQLMAGGLINETSIYWIPTKNYSRSEAIEGEDYHELKDTTRAIELEDVILPENHVVVTNLNLRSLDFCIN